MSRRFAPSRGVAAGVVACLRCSARQVVGHGPGGLSKGGKRGGRCGGGMRASGEGADAGSGVREVGVGCGGA